jgi:hypothetical protein
LPLYSQTPLIYKNLSFFQLWIKSGLEEEY